VRRRRSNPDLLSTNNLVVIGGVAAAIYIVYQIVSKLPSAAKSATAPLANAIGSGIAKIVVGAPMAGVLGDVVLPDGTDIGPLASFGVGRDSDGNVYIQSGGATYSIGQSDANGNWPATLVLESDFNLANPNSWG
jgi:hypothetical protein